MKKNLLKKFVMTILIGDSIVTIPALIMHAIVASNIFLG